MFEDRSKYDFNKIDSSARARVITENTQKSENMTEAQKKLFTNVQKESSTPILAPHKNIDTKNLPSSKYLQSFGTTATVGEVEQVQEVEQKTQQNQTNVQESETQKEKEQSNINFDSILENVSDVKIDEKAINKELKTIAPNNKKNYSFRIKLVAGVYCILVALFGGWVIGNAIDIANTNANIYETIKDQERVDANIEKIVLKIKGLDQPEDDSSLKDMIIETIDTTPEATIEPNEYTVETNWFDAFCNWLSRIFGGK